MFSDVHEFVRCCGTFSQSLVGCHESYYVQVTQSTDINDMQVMWYYSMMMGTLSLPPPWLRIGHSLEPLELMQVVRNPKPDDILVRSQATDGIYTTGCM